MQQQQKRRERGFPVLASEAQDRAARSVRIVVNPANLALLPIAEPDRLAYIPAFRNPAILLNPAAVAFAVSLYRIDFTGRFLARILLDAAPTASFTGQMRTLWFKSRFVEAILSGEKTDTIRTLSSRLPKVGEVVAFSIGPRPSFAVAVIAKIEQAAADMGPARRAQIEACYGKFPPSAVRIEFRLLPAGSEDAQPTQLGRFSPSLASAD